MLGLFKITGQRLTQARSRIPAAIKDIAASWKLTAIGGVVGMGLNSACYVIHQVNSTDSITVADAAEVALTAGIAGGVSTLVKANTAHNAPCFMIAAVSGWIASEIFAGRTEPVSLIIPALAGTLAGFAASRPERGQDVRIPNRHFD